MRLAIPHPGRISTKISWLSSSRSSSVRRCGPIAPLAPVTRMVRPISVLQQQPAPARAESVGEQQQPRASRNLPEPPKLPQIEKAISDDGVSKRRQADMEPVGRRCRRAAAECPNSID